MERTKEPTLPHHTPMVVLSFDVEECDIPCEYGRPLSLEQQLSVSTEGMIPIVDMLKRYDVQATFYTTATYALHEEEILKDLCLLGEIASHGYTHSGWKDGDIARSLEVLRRYSGQEVRGFRMPRMQAVSTQELLENGIRYNASSNPTWIPGRYCGLKDPRRPNQADGLTQFPASVTPIVRFPLFWISAHVLPPAMYIRLVEYTLRAEGYVHLYFHPWEFADSMHDPKYRLPLYLRQRCGQGMRSLLEKLIKRMKEMGCSFCTSYEFLAGYDFE